MKNSIPADSFGARVFRLEALAETHELAAVASNNPASQALHRTSADTYRSLSADTKKTIARIEAVDAAVARVRAGTTGRRRVGSP